MRYLLPIALCAATAFAQASPSPQDSVSQAVDVIKSAIGAGINTTATSASTPSQPTSTSTDDSNRAIEMIVGAIRAESNSTSNAPPGMTASPISTDIMTTSQPTASASQPTGNSQGFIGAAAGRSVQGAGLAAILAFGALAFTV
ncbi:hypothetical protein B9Z65_3845 [Elsinoe australis]|uniref:Uncharacterized protein n=1 Tax=Elsinoe australis TaxID=40998 RepID=A0A2P8A2S2_9PEZI|nr:hypothetical protein B9Z65_3845 [Elsinoe australis]